MSPGPVELVGPDVERLLVDAVRKVPGVRAVFVTGSRGRGDADRYSDVDLLAVADRAEAGAVAARIVELRPPGLAAVVLHKVLELGEVRVVSVVTADWLRYDVSVEPVELLAGHSSSTTRPAFDPEHLAQRLSPPRPPREVDPKVVERLVTEFLRVLGLLAVCHGRQDWVTAASGAVLLRQMTIQLFSEEIALEDRGGTLHLRRDLAPAAYEQLAALPPVVATADGCIVAHEQIARVFLAKARSLAERTGVRWPTALEASVSARLGPIGVALQHPRAATT